MNGLYPQTPIDCAIVVPKKTSAAVTFTRPANGTPYASLATIGINLAISGATNASPIVITSATHGLADGDPVTISSVGGNTNANGNFYAKVTGYSGTTFALYSDKALTTPVAGNSNYTTGGAVAKPLRFKNLGRIVGGSGYIVKAQLFDSKKANVIQCKLHLFTVPPAAPLDGVAYPSLLANSTYRTGQIVFPATGTEDPTTSDNANALITPNSFGSNLPLFFICAALDQDLYGLLETLTAFTPDSGETYYIRLSVEDD